MYFVCGDNFVFFCCSLQMLLFSQCVFSLPSADFFFPPLSRCSSAASSRAAAWKWNDVILSLRSSSIGGGREISAQVTDADGGGPVELPPSVDVQSSPLQSAASLLLTGAIAVFLFRSLRRRAKRVTETRFTSSGEKKALKEEALESLKKSVALPPPPSKSPTTPVQALLGALAAAVIALVLYRFTTTIESALNRQTISDNYSVRQITVTIRTIINGLCYLATFVFGANSVGLLLYSGQLAVNSFSEEPPPSEEKPSDALSSETEEDESSENTQ